MIPRLLFLAVLVLVVLSAPCRTRRDETPALPVAATDLAALSPEDARHCRLSGAMNHTQAVLSPYESRIREVIWEADSARAVYQAIRRHGVAIHERNLQDAFGVLLDALMVRYILALTKLFDVPKGYPLWNIRAAINEIRMQAGSLSFHERGYVDQQLMRLGVNEAEIPSDATACQAFLAHTLESKCPRVDEVSVASEALKAHKRRRDKHLAHSEAVDPSTFPDTTWVASEKVLDFAKLVLGVIGSGFTGMTYFDLADRYLVDFPSDSCEMAMQRLFKMAGIQRNDDAPKG